MSRHYFGTFHKGSPITVVLGWDRPMDYFFLVIEEQINSADNPMTLDHLYSNLQESDPFNHELDYYREVLRNFQIGVPESMFIEVERDREKNTGNRVVKHQTDGSYTE